MAQCDIIPLTNKACSGKCKSSSCSNAPRIWVVAACEGMISLFVKSEHGILQSPPDKNRIFSSLEGFQHFVSNAEMEQAFDQLVIVGSSNDIAWIHASLPATATRFIVAEIEYPLLPAWFGSSGISKLPQALQHLFQA